MVNYRANQLNLCVLLAIVSIVSGFSLLHADSPKTLEEFIAEKTEFKRRNPHLDIRIENVFSRYDARAIIEQAKSLSNDPNETVKKIGYRLFAAAGWESKDPIVRQIVVDALVNRLDYKNEKVLHMCARPLLRNHTRKDFSKQAKAVLRKKLHDVAKGPRRFHYSQNVILISGIADLKSEMELLRTLSKQRIGNKPTAKANWALKAMARMGDKEAIEKWISRVDSLTDEDDKLISWLGRSTYIRQPEIVDHIKPYLYSDKMFRSLGDDVIPAWYASAAAGYLGKMIVGFPTRSEVIGIFDKKLQDDLEFRNNSGKFEDFYHNYCRQWLESQTSIEMNR